MDLVTHVASSKRWPDVQKLFGDRGACGGCWCMVWRLQRQEFLSGKGDLNKGRLRDIVRGNHPPGVLAYDGDDPVGWCAVAPRSEYGFLSRSRVLAPVDSEPVWSISCLFVDRQYRRQGHSVGLIRSATVLAIESGATIVEGYPVEPARGRTPDTFAWTGLLSAFVAAGFEEVARRSPTRPIVRFFA